MKNIELTEDHKVKLLEMCVELFTDILDKNECYCNEDQGAGYTYSDEHGNCDVCEYSLFKFWDNCLHFNTDGYRVSIHWFEFCSRYLTTKLDDLYFEKAMYPVDPYHKQNKGKNLEYPNNWQELWNKRPFLMFTNNLNGTHYKKHPVDYLYEEFKKLKL